MQAIFILLSQKGYVYTCILIGSLFGPKALDVLNT